ncbi:MAG TPA: DUF4252 domain-containing protein [Bryobacteraceae bacterium]|nr:DUF4252 domain-containing protein [Bryobacteraceae bacterium]
MKILCNLVLFALLAVNCGAQALDLKNLERLTAKASNVTDVTLDGALLKLGAKFLSASDPDEAKIKNLVAGLKGIYVKTFEFEKEGEYADADVAAIRNQLKSPEWSRIVGVRSKKDKETAEIYLRTGGEGGLTIICTEPTELTIVKILGKIDLDQLSDLGGNLGVPKIEVEKSLDKSKAPKKDD